MTTIDKRNYVDADRVVVRASDISIDMPWPKAPHGLIVPWNITGSNQWCSEQSVTSSKC